MFFHVSFISVVLFTIAVSGEQLILRNGNNHKDLVFSLTGRDDITIPSKDEAIVNLDSNWSGSITAVPVNAEIVKGPRTAVELSLDGDSDRYDISLENGFNLGAKIVPKGMEKYCETISCFANLTGRICPIEHRVTNGQGTVVACKRSPSIMGLVCPRAVVSSYDSYKVKTCKSSTYLVVIG